MRRMTSKTDYLKDESEKLPAAPRNPVSGDKVLISFGDTNQLCEVTQLYSDGAVMVKEYPGVMYPHKSKWAVLPYWEWPA